MKLIAIVLIVLGLCGIAYNILLIPMIEAPQDQSQEYQIGYYVGTAFPAIIGILLIIIGAVVYRKSARKQRENSSGNFSL